MCRWQRTSMLLTVVTALALGACGEASDQDQIRHVVQQAFTNTDPNVCMSAMTPAFVQQSRLERGADAMNACRKNRKTDAAASVDFVSVQVRGHSAQAKFEPRGGNSAYKQATVRLRKPDGTWKVDRLTQVSIDRARFFQVVRRVLTSTGSLSQDAVDCALRTFKPLSDAQLERNEIQPDAALLTKTQLDCLLPSVLRNGGLPPRAITCVIGRLRKVDPAELNTSAAETKSLFTRAVHACQ